MSEQPIAPDPRSDFSRRAFLAAGAAAAASGAILAAGAAAADGPVAAPPRDPAPKGKPFKRVADGEPIRMGVIGTGGMGTGHCQAIIGLGRGGRGERADRRARATCATRGSRPRASSAESGQGIDGRHLPRLPRSCSSATTSTACSSPRPSTGTRRSAPDAIVAGKDVYVEKPMTLRPRRRAAPAQRRRRRTRTSILQVGTQMIDAAEVPRRRRTLIEAGQIGKPTSRARRATAATRKDGEWLYYGIDPDWKPGVNLDWDAWCGPLGPAPWDPEVYARWRRYKKYSTGIIGDLLVHQMTPLMLARRPGLADARRRHRRPLRRQGDGEPRPGQHRRRSSRTGTR